MPSTRRMPSAFAQIKEIAPGTFLFEVPRALASVQCERIIDRFEQAKAEQYPGRVGQGQGLDTGVKRSTDLVVSGKPQWQGVDRLLFDSLAAVMAVFRQQFPFFQGPFKDMGYAIQRTLPGEYYHWHIDGGSHGFADRQLVVVWYLNDVAGPGGETEFRVQRIKVRPEQGKMLLFPPFWTHEHRGVTLRQGVKYIATTWVLFA